MSYATFNALGFIIFFFGAATTKKEVAGERLTTRMQNACTELATEDKLPRESRPLETRPGILAAGLARGL